MTLERMVHGGLALTRLPDGAVALVAGGVPGERVEAALEQRKGVWRGEVIRVLEPSPDRVPAPTHPGLDLGFVAYPRQLALKREVLQDALRRASGRERPVEELRPSPKLWHYRASVQPALAGAGLGYRRPGTHDVVVLGEDPVADDGVRRAWDVLAAHAEALQGVREVVIRANHRGEALAALVSDRSERSLLDTAHTLVRAGLSGVGLAPVDARGRFRSGSSRLAGARTLPQAFGSMELTVQATSFAQPHPAAAAALYGRLAELAGDGRHAWELYAGAGAIAMHLAPRFEVVTALEIDRSALSRGERDAARLGLDNVRFVRGDARAAPLPSDADLLVVDPPRAGLSAALRTAILESGVPRLAYVSCDVATWARDAAAMEAGGLRLARLEPFDFYPHTHHIELLSIFER